MTRLRHHRTAARSALLWGLLLYAGCQLALNVVIERRFPELYDPEHAVRLKALQTLSRRQPDRPLLLLAGSSRTVANFRPEVLPPLATPGGEPPLVYNFSHLAAGPLMNLVQVHRLLREGVRPTWLVLEVMPPQLGDGRQNVTTASATVEDVPLLHQHQSALRFYSQFLRSRLTPCYRHRQFLVHALSPYLLPPDTRPEVERVTFGPLGGDYSLESREPLGPEEHSRQGDAARASYYPNLQKLQICELSDRAMRDLLTLCRQEGIQVVLLLTPESKEFQSWYAPEARAAVDRYCADLAGRYQVPLVDARDWLEEDDFFDHHHARLRGACRFTARLGSEVLQPLVMGTLKAAGYAGRGTQSE